MSDTSKPAFPSETQDANGDFNKGLSFREYAAVHVLQGLLASPDPPQKNGIKITVLSEFASAAVTITDALLVALNPEVKP